MFISSDKTKPQLTPLKTITQLTTTQKRIYITHLLFFRKREWGEKGELILMVERVL